MTSYDPNEGVPQQAGQQQPPQQPPWLQQQPPPQQPPWSQQPPQYPPPQQQPPQYAPPQQPPVADSAMYGEQPAFASAFSQESVSSGGSGRTIWFGALAVVVLLLGGGGFFAWRALQSTGGAASPGEGVDDLLLAINEEDFLTIGELLEPGERRTLVEPILTDVLPELERLGILEDDVDPAEIDGVDIELTDVTYEIETIPGHDDIVHVYFTGGQASTSTVAADLPWGDTLRSLAGDDLEDSSTSEAIGGDTPLVMVERDGRWYVSMWYSVAETARLEEGAVLPAIEDQPTPRGTDSPEAAVEAMIQDMVALDLSGAISRIDPEEGAALYRYAPLFLADADAAFAYDGDVNWEVTDLDFDTEADGDDAVVTIRAFTVNVNSPDFEASVRWGRDSLSFNGSGEVEGSRFDADAVLTTTELSVNGSVDGDSLDLKATFDAAAGEYSAEGIVIEGGIESRISASLVIDESGQCSRYSVAFESEEDSGCLEDLAGADPEQIQQFQDQMIFGEEISGISVTTHRTDGLWYVSPTLTAMAGFTAYLQNFDENYIDYMMEQLEQEGITGLAPVDPSGFGDVMGGGVGSVDGPLEDEMIEDAVPDYSYQTFTVEPDGTPESRFATLGEAEIHEYVVVMEAGETLGAALYGDSRVSGGIDDPVLYLFLDDGTEVAYNDDFDGLDSLIGYTAEVSGTYVLQAYELALGSGEYELILELEPPGEVPELLANDG